MPKKPLDIRPGEWTAETKYDGHRLVVHVGTDETTAWSRNGIKRMLPNHVYSATRSMPKGIFDGELIVPGKRSFSVTEHEHSEHLVFVVFDKLHSVTHSIMDRPQHDRRYALGLDFAGRDLVGVQLAESVDIASMDEALALVKTVWARDGEGIILKRKTATYMPGKRPKDAWIKIKGLQSAVLKVTGFVAGKMGPYATVKLIDTEGNETTVKTLNGVELGKLSEKTIGRELRIEFQERTPDGSYRHGRWDRFEDE